MNKRKARKLTDFRQRARKPNQPYVVWSNQKPRLVKQTPLWQELLWLAGMVAFVIGLMFVW